MKKAIKDHLRDFIAILVLVILGVVTTGVIIVSQHASIPSWVPFIGTERFDIHAEITSAQAVTPGQGQTVIIAGIKVGEIKAVDLENGNANLTLAIEPKYAPLIRDNASILLRPRTGLQDMTVALDPGTRNEPAIKENATIPLASSLRPIQPDEILATLDGDTRGFLQILLANAAQGLHGNRSKLSATLRRLDPLARDLAKLNTLLAKRRENIARSIHNFGLLSGELANHDRQLAEFVTSSNAVFRSFANQQANLQETVAELPSTLRSTRSALESGDRLARVSKPALTRLIPQAQATGPALRALRPLFHDTTLPIRDQIRPFTRKVKPVIRHLSQGSVPLAKSTVALRGAFVHLNQLFNGLAYNPAGQQEGYLFWASWLSHNVNSVFGAQDAGGVLTRGLVILNCQTAQLAENVTATRPQLNTIRQVTNTPTTTLINSKGGCG